MAGGPVLKARTVHEFTGFSQQQKPHEVRTIIFFVLQMSKLKHREDR